jgi:hypothetical protein
MDESGAAGSKTKRFHIRMAPSMLSFVLHRIDAMEEFRYFTVSAIESEKKSISERFDKATNELSEEEKAEYYEWNSEDYFMVSDVFSQISLRSFVVVLYSYIEDGMNVLCNAEYSDRARLAKIQGLPDFKIKYKDMKGEGIDRAKTYLEKVIGRDLHSGEQLWSEIDTLRKIRNAIVHADAKANDKIKGDGNFKRHVQDGSLGLEHERTIVINVPYLDYILDNVRQFFNSINVKNAT